MITFCGEPFAIRQTEYRKAVYGAGVVSGSVSTSVSAVRALAFFLEVSFAYSGGCTSLAGSKYRMRPQELQVTMCSLVRSSCQVCGRNMTKHAMHFCSRASEMADLRCRITRS